MHYGQCPLEYQIQHEIFFALHRLTWKSQLLNGLTPPFKHLTKQATSGHYINDMEKYTDICQTSCKHNGSKPFSTTLEIMQDTPTIPYHAVTGA